MPGALHLPLEVDRMARLTSAICDVFLHFVCHLFADWLVRELLNKVVAFLYASQSAYRVHKTFIAVCRKFAVRVAISSVLSGCCVAISAPIVISVTTSIVDTSCISALRD